jgi:hypothetical protein
MVLFFIVLCSYFINYFDSIFLPTSTRPSHLHHNKERPPLPPEPTHLSNCLSTGVAVLERKDAGRWGKDTTLQNIDLFLFLVTSAYAIVGDGKEGNESKHSQKAPPSATSTFSCRFLAEYLAGAIRRCTVQGTREGCHI